MSIVKFRHPSVQNRSGFWRSKIPGEFVKHLPVVVITVDIPATGADLLFMNFAW